jgi:hypothetical protein
MSMFCFFTSVVGYTSGGVLCDGLRKILQLSVRQSVYPSRELDSHFVFDFKIFLGKFCTSIDG